MRLMQHGCKSTIVSASLAHDLDLSSDKGKSMKRAGFTLIEVLIVVVIMATLAAVVIPQFSSSAEDAKAAGLKHNLHTLREIIQIYQAYHGGSSPSLVSGDLPGLTM